MKEDSALIVRVLFLAALLLGCVPEDPPLQQSQGITVGLNGLTVVVNGAQCPKVPQVLPVGQTCEEAYTRLTFTGTNPLHDVVGEDPYIAWRIQASALPAIGQRLSLGTVAYIRRTNAGFVVNAVSNGEWVSYPYIDDVNGAERCATIVLGSPFETHTIRPEDTHQWRMHVFDGVSLYAMSALDSGLYTLSAGPNVGRRGQRTEGIRRIVGWWPYTECGVVVPSTRSDSFDPHYDFLSYWRDTQLFNGGEAYWWGW